MGIGAGELAAQSRCPQARQGGGGKGGPTKGPPRQSPVGRAASVRSPVGNGYPRPGWLLATTHM